MSVDTKSFADLITFTRASTATRVNASGLIETVANDVPRFDYDPVTLTALGLLIEGGRTNLLLRSQEFDDATWVKTSATVTANAVASPDGTTNADKIVVSNAITLGLTTGAGVSQDLTKPASNTAYSYTVYAKAGEFNKLFLRIGNAAGTINSSARFNLDAGTVDAPVINGALSATVSIQPAGNGWYRCTLRSTSSTDTSLKLEYLPGDGTATTGNGASGVYVWGAQLEQAVHESSYIPTTTATVTRALENCAVNSAVAAGLAAAESTLLLDYSWGPAIPNFNGASRCLWYWGDGTTANRVQLTGASNRVVAFTAINANVVTGSNNNSGIPVANQLYKTALRIRKDDMAMISTGAPIVYDTSTNIPARSTMYLGSVAGTSFHGFAYIRNLRLMPRAYRDAELSALIA